MALNGLLCAGVPLKTYTLAFMLLLEQCWSRCVFRLSMLAFTCQSVLACHSLWAHLVVIVWSLRGNGWLLSFD